MIFSAFQREDPDMLLTIVKRNDTYITVGMDAQELFKAALGEKEWERRVAKAYFDETGQDAPPPPKPLEIESVTKMKQRFIDLGEVGKPITP
jgi:hypothetical protein